RSGPHLPPPECIGTIDRRTIEPRYLGPTRTGQPTEPSIVDGLDPPETAADRVQQAGHQRTDLEGPVTLGQAVVEPERDTDDDDGAETGSHRPGRRSSAWRGPRAVRARSSGAAVSCATRGPVAQWQSS